MLSLQFETALEGSPELIAVSTQNKTVDKGRTVSVMKSLEMLLTRFPKISL